MPGLQFKHSDQNVQWFVNLLEHDQLNLKPAFQRLSVWPESSRRKLMHSVFVNYPIPSVFLYERAASDTVVYDVIDGKQRLESLFMFMGAKSYRQGAYWFAAEPEEFDDDAERPTKRTRLYWKDLSDAQKHQFRTYRVPVVEVAGDFPDIIDVFVRINSTGKALTTAEIRHARYLDSRFLKAAAILARKLEDFVVEHRVLTPAQMVRMRDVELVAELMASLHAGRPLDKKSQLDQLIAGDRAAPMRLSDVERSAADTQRVIRLTGRLFPDLRETRFRHVADFYSLCLLVHEWEGRRFVLTDGRARQLASSLLASFGAGVDRARDKQRRLEDLGEDERTFADYLRTVQEGTDTLRQRKLRADILRSVFEGVFEHKDWPRGFTPEQRRVIWFASRDKRCCECQKKVAWDTFEVHHIAPHSRGGKTDLANAALLCGPCNSKLGDRA